MQELDSFLPAGSGAGDEWSGAFLKEAEVRSECFLFLDRPSLRTETHSHETKCATGNSANRGRRDFSILTIKHFGAAIL